MGSVQHGDKSKTFGSFLQKSIDSLKLFVQSPLLPLLSNPTHPVKNRVKSNARSSQNTAERIAAPVLTPSLTSKTLKSNEICKAGNSKSRKLVLDTEPIFNEEDTSPTNSSLLNGLEVRDSPKTKLEESQIIPSPEQKKVMNTLDLLSTNLPSIFLKPCAIPACDSCNKIFVSHDALETHKFLEHLTDLSKKKYSRKKSNKFSGNVHKCVVHGCGRGFDRIGDLYRHYRRIHPPSKNFSADVTEVDIIVLKSAGKIFRCHICDKIVKCNRNLQLHLATHREKEHSCEICGKKFSQKCYLKLHKTVHSNSKPFPCPECSAAYLSPAALEQHLKRRHDFKFEGKGCRWPCGNCDLVYSTQQGLSSHIRKGACQFVNELPQCDRCLTRFKSARALGNHMQSKAYMRFNCTKYYT